MTAQDPQRQNQQLGQQGGQNEQRATPANGGQASRSEDLLPAGDSEDGRFDVAEEVNLDQQSDATRRVGQTPQGMATEGLADSLKPEKLKGEDGQDSQGGDA